MSDALEVYRKAGRDAGAHRAAGHAARQHDRLHPDTEGAAAFDDLTRSKDIKDPSLGNWPNTFRTHRFVPAVEYIRAQRARTLLIPQMES